MRKDREGARVRTGKARKRGPGRRFALEETNQPTLFRRKRKNLLLLAYVDDCVKAGSDGACAWLIDETGKKFETKKTGQAGWMLGVSWKGDSARVSGWTHLSWAPGWLF